MPSPSLPALVLIGEPGDPVAEALGAPARGLICVHGQPMLQRLVATLRECGCEIVIVGNESLRDAVAAVTEARFEASPPRISAKLQAGCAALGWPRQVMMCAADSPFVTADGLRQLMTSVIERDLELGYPIVPKEACEAQFPGGHRTYVKMKDGVFTGGNFLTISGAVVRDQGAWIDRFFDARKSPLALANLLGSTRPII